MVAIGIIEPVLLVLGIEVPARRFEVGAFALGNLMKVDGVLSGREVVQVELERNARALIPDR